MKSSVKLYSIVIVCIIIIGFITLNSGLLKINEGMSQKEKAAKMLISKLQLELNNHTSELKTSTEESKNIQKKIDLLKTQIGSKQAVMDRLQDKIQADNLTDSL